MILRGESELRNRDYLLRKYPSMNPVIKYPRGAQESSKDPINMVLLSPNSRKPEALGIGLSKLFSMVI